MIDVGMEGNSDFVKRIIHSAEIATGIFLKCYQNSETGLGIYDNTIGKAKI